MIDLTDMKSLENKIKRRNSLATYLIAMLISISFLSLMFLSKQQDKVAETINLSGSQRMLSQKITYLAYQHYQNVMVSEIDQTLIIDLVDTARLFSTNQIFLTNLVINKSSIMPKEISALYFSAPINLNNQVDFYVAEAIALSQTQEKLIATRIIEQSFNRDSIDDFLASLDLVVTTIEQHTNQRITYIERLEAALWLITILLLVLINLYIFRPLQRLISHSHNALLLSKRQSAELTLAINKHAIVYRVSMNKKGSLTEVNQAFLDFYCYSEAEILGQSVFKIRIFASGVFSISFNRPCSRPVARQLATKYCDDPCGRLRTYGFWCLWRGGADAQY